MTDTKRAAAVKSCVAQAGQMPSKSGTRVLVLTGAGASMDFGAPSTPALTELIENKVTADRWLKDNRSDIAYRHILETLAGYLTGGKKDVNFEHIFHCAHELLYTFEPTAGAVNEYRPLLVPFVTRQVAFEQEALRQLVDRMATFIFEVVVEACSARTASLDPLAAFIAKLRTDATTRIYTTNYDDFLLEAAPDLYTGFDPVPAAGAKRFQRDRFWQQGDVDSLLHLHGSVHMGFGHPLPGEVDLGVLHWFDDRTAALTAASQTASPDRRMDGRQEVQTAVVTGLDKLSRLQQLPLSHFYASLAQDAMTADIIYVIGSGLGDLHLNTWLGEARRRSPKPKLIFVDWWRDSFMNAICGPVDRKLIEMIHTLLTGIDEPLNATQYGSGWTVAKNRSCAIWDKGFLEFLNAPAELAHVLSLLG